MNSIDVSDVEKKYRSTAGNPAYSRRMLLRLVIMVSIDAVWSSRKIAKQAHENVVYMYLTGDAKPDFRTISKFKKDCKELSYNPQISVDSNSGIIAANDVTQDCTDHYQLQPQVEMVEANSGELPEGTKTSSDNGYFSGPNLRYLEEKDLDGYIPDSKQAQKHKGKKVVDSQYSKDKFEYDEANDQFIGPNGDVLVRKGEYMVKDKLQYSYSGANCSECPFQAECAGKDKRRKIASDGYEAERRRMAAKMQSEAGKEESKKRMATVEWPFGYIKHNMKVMWAKIGRMGISLREIVGLVSGQAAKVAAI